MGLYGNDGQIQCVCNFLGAGTGLDESADFHFRGGQLQKACLAVPLVADQFDQLILNNVYIGVSDLRGVRLSHRGKRRQQACADGLSTLF